MVSAAGAACANHPQREALGVCVRCRKRICSECVTRVEGINYCVACLAELSAAGDARAVAPSPATKTFSRALRGASAIFLFLVLSILAWGLVEATLPGSG